MSHRLSQTMIALFAVGCLCIALASPLSPASAPADEAPPEPSPSALTAKDAEASPPRNHARRSANPQRNMPYFSFGGLLPRRES